MHQEAKHEGHQAHRVGDFRRRFWISLALTVPILAFVPAVQRLLGLEQALQFTGSAYLQLGLATAVFFYGGWPFLRGLIGEVRMRRPGMVTLIGLAITVAFAFSAAVVVFRIPRDVLFWELATLVDIMLLGHWIEMRSVLGASRALEELVRLMPDSAHRVREDGSVQDVPLAELKSGDRVLVKPGEKLPTDGVIVEGRTSVNQAMLTGESMLVERGEGDAVLGGAVNGDSAVTRRVEKTGVESFLNQVSALGRLAEVSRS
ncbi:MAG: heavy metal translocating P-type ATPase, partial [Candidatus Bipolaricaulia bacterium]